MYASVQACRITQPDQRGGYFPFEVPKQNKKKGIPQTAAKRLGNPMYNLNQCKPSQ
jgi:hypothetical protein